MDKKAGKKENQTSEKLIRTGKEVSQNLEEKLKVAANQWQTTFDAIKDAISLIDAEGKILRCNKAMSDLLGKPFQEIIGRKCWELVHGTSEPIPGCPVVRMKETRQRETLELPIGDKWFKITADPILDESEGFKGAIYIISDISEHKRVEEALKQSENRYRYIVETTNEGVWISDSEKLTTHVNTSLAQMLGYEPEEMIGVPIESFIPAEDIADHNSQMAIRHSGKSSKYERRLKRKDGSICYCLFSGTAMHDTEGRVAGAFAVVTDITERKQAEEEVRQLNKSYDRLTDNADETIFRVEAEGGHVIYCNSAAERIFGYSLAEWRADPALGYKMIHPDYKEKQKQVIEQINNTKQPVRNVELGWMAKDGKTVLVEYSIIPICNAKGEIIFFESIGKDITKHKRAEEEIRLKMMEIERLNKLFIGREHRMIELKREVNTLLERLGQSKKYEIPDHVKERGENQVKEENREA